MTGDTLMAQYLRLGDPLYEISRHQKPVLIVNPGDTVTIETEDAHTHQIRKPGDRRDRKTVPYSNPVSGPILVRGAEPGDALRVSIHRVDSLEGLCETYAPLHPLVMPYLGVNLEDQTRICRVDREGVHWDDGLVLPYRPMIGCIATVPELGTPTCNPAGDYGGNLDLREVTEGAVLLLPVFVAGALLYIGDCHASQGEGELSGCALEMRGKVTVSISIQKAARIPGPRIETKDNLFAVATGRPLEEAIALAFSRLALWLEAEFGWTRWEAYSLLTQIGTLSIGHFSSGTVAAGIPRDYVKTRGGG